GVRTGKRGAGEVELADGPPQQVARRLRLRLLPGQQPAEALGRAGQPDPQRLLRRDQLPDAGDGAGHEGGREVEERGSDHRRAGRAERCRAAGEVAAPEPAPARLLIGRTRLGREVGHRVDRLEQGPHRTRHGRVSHQGRITLVTDVPAFLPASRVVGVLCGLTRRKPAGSPVEARTTPTSGKTSNKTSNGESDLAGGGAGAAGSLSCSSRCAAASSSSPCCLSSSTWSCPNWSGR